MKRLVCVPGLPCSRYASEWSLCGESRKTEVVTVGIPASIVVPADVGAVKTARDWVGVTLGEWGRDPYIAKVVVSELVTNVVRHTASETATVRVLLADRGTVVEVLDGCDAMPQVRDVGVLSEDGRGLAMLGALVKDWGAQPVAGGGKVVWALLPEEDG
ncbi:ATP-binding protein [Actinomadura sediminis]|uniref:ATP-binding protein n=1 Tax=Actinomadura sediminis TaxID=1038904 RepID=A0ABW3EI37_9ACTN